MDYPRLINDDTGEQYALESAELVIGRDPSAGVVVQSPAVSNRHAGISKSKTGEFLIRDFGSMNGTYVNEVRIKEVHLSDGNLVRIGNTTFRFALLPPPPIAPGKPSTVSTKKMYSGLWHPVGITLVGIPLGFAFASVLIALNWHRLRRHGLAFLAYVLGTAYVCGVQLPLLPLFVWPWPYVVGVVIWFPILGLPQWQYMRRHVPKPFPRRGWIMALGIGVAIQATLVIWSISEEHTRWRPNVLVSGHESARDFSAEDVSNGVGQFVGEVSVTWKERSLLILSRPSGARGSVVLFRTVKGKALLVTNRHVVAVPSGATEVELAIHFEGAGPPVPADVVAFGKNGLDLAMLRIASPDIPDGIALPIAKMDEISVGEPCVAIGNALGYGKSVTVGVISRFDHFGQWPTLRTSAPISPGNSGGALFSLHGGRLLGITTATLLGAGAQNMNVAIPAEHLLIEDSWDFIEGKKP